MALQHLGIELINRDYIEEGLDILVDVTEKNETDNTGAREIIMEVAVLNRLKNYVTLMNKKYPGDHSLISVYANTIHEFLIYGKKPRAKRAALKAFKRNVYPMLILVGEERETPNESEYFRLNTKEEAYTVMPFINSVLIKNPKSIYWLTRVFAESKYSKGL